MAWNTYGANTPVLDNQGTPINLTGQNHYVRSNSPRLQAGLARVDAAPTIFTLGTPVTGIQSSVDSTADSYGIEAATSFTSTDALIAGGATAAGTVLAYVGVPVNSTRNFFKGPYQLMETATVAAAATAANLATAFASLTNANGVLAVGQRRGFQFRLTYDDGRLPTQHQLIAPVVQDGP